jgi:hypothetical protein
MAMAAMGHSVDIGRTFSGHLFLMSAYRDSVLVALIERLNTAVDLLLSHTLEGEALERLQAEVREMTEALSAIAVLIHIMCDWPARNIARMDKEFEMEYRIVVIDDHIIAQAHHCGWYTCSKAHQSQESDLAVWPFSQENMNKAVKLIGNVAVVQSNAVPLKRGNSWYISPDDLDAKSYNQALRELASAQS